MMLLRKLCNTYKDKILNYHKQKGHKVPTAYNSRAAQGNFLETLNMSLNCKSFLRCRQRGSAFDLHTDEIGLIIDL
jgi:hypothetical protein